MIKYLLILTFISLSVLAFYLIRSIRAKDNNHPILINKIHDVMLFGNETIVEEKNYHPHGPFSGLSKQGSYEFEGFLKWKENKIDVSIKDYKPIDLIFYKEEILLVLIFFKESKSEQFKFFSFNKKRFVNLNVNDVEPMVFLNHAFNNLEYRNKLWIYKITSDLKNDNFVDALNFLKYSIEKDSGWYFRSFSKPLFVNENSVDFLEHILFLPNNEKFVSILKNDFKSLPIKESDYNQSVVIYLRTIAFFNPDQFEVICKYYLDNYKSSLDAKSFYEELNRMKEEVKDKNWWNDMNELYQERSQVKE